MCAFQSSQKGYGSLRRSSSQTALSPHSGPPGPVGQARRVDAGLARGLRAGGPPLVARLRGAPLELRRVLRARFPHDPPPFPRNGNGAETELDLSTDSGQIQIDSDSDSDSGPSSPWGWLALLPVPAFVALAVLPVRSNRVELYEDRLVVVYAGTRSAIPYAHVRGACRTRSLWAGTANSLDRVLIEAPWDGDAIVSVKDNDALVDELERRCGLRPGRPRPAAGRPRDGGRAWVPRSPRDHLEADGEGGHGE